MAAAALSSLVSLALLWILLVWLYRDYRVDLFRQRMFALRDELFDLAAAGDVGFDDPAYGMVRSTMNGHIRFAHKIGAVSLLAAVLTVEEEEVAGYTARLQQRLDTLDERSQHRIETAVRRMNELVIGHVVATSPVALCLAAPVAALRLGFGAVTGVARRVSGAAHDPAAAASQPASASDRLMDRVDALALTAGAPA